MTWTSVGVNLSPGGPRQTARAAALALAERFDARLVGMAVAHPAPAVAGDAYGVGELLVLEREALDQTLKIERDAFARDTGGRGLETSWREAVTFGSSAAWMTTQARAVDVIVTAPSDPASLVEGPRVNIADVVMGAGRPVLIAPSQGRLFGFKTMVVAWKDSRESRRVLADALPLLALAEKVVLLQVFSGATPRTSVVEAGFEVVAWLHAHGVAAGHEVEHTRHDETLALRAAVDRLDPDVLVAGAYGRARMREWVLGGVTCDYLLSPDRCVLLSH